MNKAGFQLNKYLICYIIAIGGLLFGFDTAVISGTLEFVVAQFHLNALEEGSYVGYGLYGCIIGVLISGILADKAGRKKSALSSAALYACSALGCAYAGSFGWLCFYRLLGGLAVGISSTLVPLYISEIAPANKRGGMVAVYQLLLTTGILIAYVSNSLILNFFIKSDLVAYFHFQIWRPMYIALAAPALIYLILLFFIPESPIWLRTNGFVIDSKKISDTYDIAIDDQKKSNVQLAIIFKKAHFRKLLIGILIPFLGQFTGINAIIYYGPRILSQVGLGTNSSFEVQILFGVINMVTTFIAIRKVDKIGRKPLLIYGVSGIILSLISLAVLAGTNASFILVFFILLFIACYAFSLGPVQWVVISEMFPSEIRGRAVSICTFFLWVAAALIGNFFPFLLSLQGIAFCFAVFAAISIVLLILIVSMLNENKGKTLGEVDQNWQD